MKWLVLVICFVSCDCGLIRNNLESDTIDTDEANLLTKNLRVPNSTEIVEVLYNRAMKIINEAKDITGDIDKDTSENQSEVNYDMYAKESIQLIDSLLRHFSLSFNGTDLVLGELKDNCTSILPELNPENKKTEDGNPCDPLKENCNASTKVLCVNKSAAAGTSSFVGDSCPSGKDRADDGTCVTVE